MRNTLDSLQVSLKFRDAVGDTMDNDSVLDAEPHLADPNVPGLVPATFDKAGSGCVDIVIVAHEHDGVADLQLTALTILT